MGNAAVGGRDGRAEGGRDGAGDGGSGRALRGSALLKGIALRACRTGAWNRQAMAPERYLTVRFRCASFDPPSGPNL